MTAPNRAALLELADRVEQASGPDRELDAEIALATGIVHERCGDWFYGHKQHSVMVMERGYYDHDGNAPELPRWTASLDAALSLVPDGFGFIVASSDPGLSPRPWAAVYRLEVWAPKFAQFNAATPALALCRAALRALAAEAGDA